VSFFDPSTWDDPFVDLYDKGKSVVDKATDVARDAVAVAEILGDGIVDAAETVGDGLVTAGEGVAKWSVSAAGDAIDWSKTSYAEVAEWTENAAGDVAGFSVEAFNEARGALETGATWVWEQIAAYFYETLPVLGGIDDQARQAASYLLTLRHPPHVRHAVRTKPCSKSPHTPKPASSSFTNSGSPWPLSSRRARKPGKWRRTSTAASQSWVCRGT
jgi:hypothetical protein